MIGNEKLLTIHVQCSKVELGFTRQTFPLLFDRNMTVTRKNKLSKNSNEKITTRETATTQLQAPDYGQALNEFRGPFFVP